MTHLDKYLTSLYGLLADSNKLITCKYNGTKLDSQGTAARAECCKMLTEAYKVIYK